MPNSQILLTEQTKTHQHSSAFLQARPKYRIHNKKMDLCRVFLFKSELWPDLAKLWFTDYKKKYISTFSINFKVRRQKIALLAVSQTGLYNVLRYMKCLKHWEKMCWKNTSNKKLLNHNPYIYKTELNVWKMYGSVQYRICN